MRYIYNILLYLLLPFILIRLLWRSRKNSMYRERWSERFGCFNFPYKNKKVIWIHAVSLGETIASIPLIKALQLRYPEKLLVVTTMTPTGSAQVQKALGSSVFHVFVPYDYPDAVQRFLNSVRPELAIIMETELWPNILYYAHKRHIPVLLANARLSPRSVRNYKKVNFFVKKMLRCISQVAAQSNLDAERFISLGIPESKVTLVGNIKFDLNLPSELIAQGKLLRTTWGDRPAWIAASTHPGEEEIILAAHAEILEKIPDCLLLLVPRHAERANEIMQLCSRNNFSYVTRTNGAPVTAVTTVFLANTTGEMFLFYAAADIAFVGGSFVAIGGHNLLEPAALGLPTITGPQLFKQLKIAELMNKAGANVVVHNAHELAAAVIFLLQNKSAALQAGDAGKRVVADNQGALQRHMSLVEELMSSRTK